MKRIMILAALTLAGCAHTGAAVKQAGSDLIQCAGQTIAPTFQDAVTRALGQQEGDWQAQLEQVGASEGSRLLACAVREAMLAGQAVAESQQRSAFMSGAEIDANVIAQRAALLIHERGWRFAGESGR